MVVDTECEAHHTILAFSCDKEKAIIFAKEASKTLDDALFNGSTIKVQEIPLDKYLTGGIYYNSKIVYGP